MRLKEKLREGLQCNKKGYLDSYKDNIFSGEMNEDFQEMFEKGSGGELHSKAEAVHSSSMLSYNLLHWINEGNPFEFEGVKYTKVYFEVKMRTLCGRSNPANMDVVLQGKLNNVTHLLFVESKFLEYLENGKFELSESYKKSINWYNKEINWNEVINVAEYLCKQKGYNSGIKQTITHLFGINGLCDKRALEWFNKNGKLKINNFDNIVVAFVNFIFEPNKHEFEEEYNAYKNYKELYDLFVSKLPESVKKPQWYSYSKVWNDMRSQINNKELIEFIENRYMKFAQ